MLDAVGVRSVVATFNTHAGMDGYGRRFDLVEACAAIGADVLVLVEVFAPHSETSQPSAVAAALGYHVVELPLSRAWRVRRPFPAPDDGSWEPQRPYPRARRALRIGTYLARHPPAATQFEEGTWGIAVLSREPIVSSEPLELGKLTRDVTHRAALSVVLESGLRVVATHMAHFSQGSPLHLMRLRPLLPDPGLPAVLAGDMNFWGPPLSLALPGWRRAARGRSWPARRPLHQLDHLFVTRAVRIEGAGGAVKAGNSDHLPIRAVLSYEPPAETASRPAHHA